MHTFKQATPDDAEFLASILIQQSGGIVEHLVGNLVLGLTAQDILSAFLMKGELPYSSENIVIAMQRDAITGMCFAYPSSEHVISTLMANFIPTKRLNTVRRIFDTCIPDSLYINTFWAENSSEKRQLEQALLLDTDSRCRLLGLSGLSKFCWNDDEEHMRLLHNNDFTLHQHFSKEEIPLEEHKLGGSLLFRKSRD